MVGTRHPFRAAHLAVLVALAAALGCAGAGGPGGGPHRAGATVSGKVTREGEGIGGARVLAYAAFSDLVAHRPAHVGGPTADDGTYRLELPGGTWYLLARRAEGAPDGPLPVGGLVSFPGSNPFTLTPGTAVEANFSLARKAAAPQVEAGPEAGAGTLAGTVSWQGRPLAGVSVKLYLDADSDFRGMGYAAAPPTDETGVFRFDFLPESAYYVVARRRVSGPGEGPLGEGDFYGWHPDNPVTVQAGTMVTIDLEVVSKGRAAGNADTRPRPSGTRIAGRLLDTAGAAAAGVHAFAYEEKVMAHRKPAFLSAPADGEGRYVLNLSRGGTFYIGARSGYGDSPAKGEWYGLFDGTPDHSVTVAPGESREGVDIVVERILP